MRTRRGTRQLGCVPAPRGPGQRTPSQELLNLFFPMLCLLRVCHLNLDNELFSHARWPTPCCPTQGTGSCELLPVRNTAGHADSQSSIRMLGACDLTTLKRKAAPLYNCPQDTQHSTRTNVGGACEPEVCLLLSYQPFRQKT